jgi:hypothetical protein
MQCLWVRDRCGPNGRNQPDITALAYRPQTAHGLVEHRNRFHSVGQPVSHPVGPAGVTNERLLTYSDHPNDTTVSSEDFQCCTNISTFRSGGVRKRLSCYTPTAFVVTFHCNISCIPIPLLGMWSVV